MGIALRSESKTFTALARFTDGTEAWITYRSVEPARELVLGDRTLMFVGHVSGVPLFREYQQVKVRL